MTLDEVGFTLWVLAFFVFVVDLMRGTCDEDYLR